MGERKMEEMKSRLNGSSQGSSSSSGKRDVRRVEARRFPGEKGYREERGEGSGSWKNRIESESEEEYDSELDDFIDDRSMENNKFSSIMMEEARSARIGRQEDLEDIRREEEENKRKMMKKFRR